MIPPHKILSRRFTHGERGVIWATLEVSLNGVVVEVNGESSVSENDAAHNAIRRLSLKAQQLRKLRQPEADPEYQHDREAIEFYERDRNG